MTPGLFDSDNSDTRRDTNSHYNHQHPLPRGTGSGLAAGPAPAASAKEESFHASKRKTQDEPAEDCGPRPQGDDHPTDPQERQNTHQG